MSEVLPEQDARIDRESKMMLQALRGGEWMRGLKLRRAADLGENRQVFYRMEKHLLPAGLVEEAARESNDEVRRFRLTRHGEKWVEDQGEELLKPETREEIREYAFEGYKAGTSAQDSVQNYRKKLHRVKQRVERAEETVEEIGDAQAGNDDEVGYLRERTQAVRHRSIDNRNRLESGEESVEEQATIESVEVVRDGLSDAERRLTAVEDKQAGLTREQAEAARTRARLRGLAKPAGYLAAGAVGVYLVVVVAVAVLAPGLVASALIGGFTGALGVAVGIGVALYARGSLSWFGNDDG